MLANLNLKKNLFSKNTYFKLLQVGSGSLSTTLNPSSKVKIARPPLS